MGVPNAQLGAFEFGSGNRFFAGFCVLRQPPAKRSLGTDSRPMGIDPNPTDRMAHEGPEMRLDAGMRIALALVANDLSEDSADGEEDALSGAPTIHGPTLRNAPASNKFQIARM